MSNRNRQENESQNKTSKRTRFCKNRESQDKNETKQIKNPPLD